MAYSLFLMMRPPTKGKLHSLSYYKEKVIQLAHPLYSSDLSALDFFLWREFVIFGIDMESLTSLVFYTNLVLKIVILYVRLNLVLGALCNFRNWVPDFGNQ